MNDETIRLIVENGELRTCLYLVKNGVPFDVAFSLGEAELLAWSIIFGELDGNAWSWESMSWRKDS